MRRYAEGTQVPVERSRAEIASILERFGVRRMGWVSEPEGDTLQFELDGCVYRLAVSRPIAQELLVRHPRSDPDVLVEAEWRRRWRALVLLLKAKLEFAEGGASSAWRELLPYAVLTDGRTVEEAIQTGETVALLPARTSRA